MNREALLAKIRTREDIVTRIRTVLIESLGVRRAPDEIDPDAPLFGTGLGLDSVDAVELVVSLEAAFQIRFPQNVSARRAMRTVGTVADAVTAMLASNEAAVPRA